MLRCLILLISFCIFIPAHADQYQFEMPDLKGKHHRLSDYRGKWVVVNYWATWCPPCLDEIPELVEFHEKHNKTDKAIVLGIDYEEVDRAYLKTFIEEYFINYPILLPDLKQKPPFGRLLGLPTTYVISPDGKLAATKVGGITRKWLEEVTSMAKAHAEK